MIIVINKNHNDKHVIGLHALITVYIYIQHHHDLLLIINIHQPFLKQHSTAGTSNLHQFEVDALLRQQLPQLRKKGALRIQVPTSCLPVKRVKPQGKNVGKPRGNMGKYGKPRDFEGKHRGKYWKIWDN